MKRLIAVILIVFCILALAINTSYATQNDIDTTHDKMEEKKQKFTEKYGTDAYWMAGYIIEDIVQPYSIPFCIAGIIVGLVFQYVMGTRRLDYKQRGFGTVIVFVTILAICQVLPFIYALVLFGWRA